jgi:hypothetical protein
MGRFLLREDSRSLNIVSSQVLEFSNILPDKKAANFFRLHRRIEESPNEVPRIPPWSKSGQAVLTPSRGTAMKNAPYVSLKKSSTAFLRSPRA